MESLQYAFIKSKGEPVVVDGDKVVQADVIPISRGIVTISFIGKPGLIPSGVAIKVSKKGYIRLSDGSKAKFVLIWNLEDLPPTVEHEVNSPDRRLLVWNIYKVTPTGPNEADYWTGNAGMVVQHLSEVERTYSCSDGLGPFSKADMIFTLRWRESTE